MIINILSKDNKNEYVVSPDEYVYLIDNADNYLGENLIYVKGVLEGFISDYLLYEN